MFRALTIFLALVATCSAAAVAAPVNIAVDIDSTQTTSGALLPAVDTQPGFTSWDCTQSPFPTLTVQGVTFVLGGVSSPNLQSSYRDGSLPGEVPGDSLLRDFALSDAGGNAMNLRIAGLAPGTYIMQTWHYDGLPTVLASPNNRMDAIVQNDGGLQPVVEFVNRAFGMSAATFQFTVSDLGEAKNVRFSATNGSTGRTRLNGFTLVTVPEPSSFFLILFGATSFPLWLRRCR